MGNVYDVHLENLRALEADSSPAISIYVPLRWNDYIPGKIFQALHKAADQLLVKNGHKKLSITTPDWDRWVKQGTVTLAIFHHNGITNFIPLPTRMQPRVVVANSFHVKPIITASQEYIDGLVLHFNERGASLYRVHPGGEALIECYLPSEFLPKTDWPSRIDRIGIRDFLEFLQQEIKSSITGTTKMIGISGGSFPELQSEAFWRRTKLPVNFYQESFKSVIPHNSISMMRLRLSQFVNEKHSQSVRNTIGEKDSLEEFSTVKSLIPKLMNKEIKKLCVSLDCMYFGEIDALTGNILLNKTQSNAIDDDVLDDLVELALAKGVEVSVVPKKFLPYGRSFVAS